MSTANYLIAKYIPDLNRNEPRNIGIIVWSDQGVAARFSGEKSQLPGQVDGRRLPGFITSLSAYKQWIAYWRSELTAIEATFAFNHSRAGQMPASLQSLKTASKDNFRIDEGGWVSQRETTFVLEDVVDHLYAQLVSTNQAEEVRDLTLDDVCDRLINFVGVKDDPNFHDRFSVPCEIRPGTVENYEFSHAYKNGSLKRLYQRVPFTRRGQVLQRNVHDAAWKFEKVTQNGIIAPDQGAALVYVNADQQQDTEIIKSLNVLSSVTRVINLIDQDEAVKEFEGLAELSHH